MLDGMRDDIRYTARSLLARPGFLIATVLTLALGIGANAAIFSVINGVMLRPLPFPDPDRLVTVFNRYPELGLDNAGVSIPDYLDRREAAGIEDLAIVTAISLNYSGGGTPQRLSAQRVSASLFSVLGVAPLLGRSFDAADIERGKDDELVLSYGTWQAQFGARRDVLGADVVLSGKRYTVIGVMPPGFYFPDRGVQLWVPFVFTPEQRQDEQRGNEFSSAVGRMRPGATVEQLDAQFAAIIQRNAERIGALDAPGAADFGRFLASGGFQGRARPLHQTWIGDIGGTLVLLQGATLLVLLIACANVANLVLTRAVGRRREFTVRGAMGAGRGRIARQLLTESLLLATLGGVAGVALAYVLTEALARSLGFDLEAGRFSFELDAGVLGFAGGLIVLTGIVFGLAPMLAQSQLQPYDVLKEGTRGSGEGRAARALRGGLVVAQTALAVLLLVGAGLLLKSFAKLASVDPGFDAEGVVTAQLNLPPERYPEGPARVQFYDRVLEAVRATPGLGDAALIMGLPFSSQFWTSSFVIEGRDQADGAPRPHGHYRVVDERYFDTVGIPLLKGRWFTPADGADAEQVVVIDELLARRHFGDSDPIGRRIGFDNPDPALRQWWTIIGVVATINQGDLGSAPDKESYYRYYKQAATSLAALAVRSSLDLESASAALRAAVLKVDPEQPVYDVRTLSDRVARSLNPRRAPMHLLLAFAVTALVLAAIGIYGVLAFLVMSRTGEIGVRMAIGAAPARVMRELLRQGAWLAGGGLALGVVAALVAGRAVEAKLFGVSRYDPTIYAAVVVLLAAVALLACWLPARRAASIAPTEALRHE